MDAAAVSPAIASTPVLLGTVSPCRCANCPYAGRITLDSAAPPSRNDDMKRWTVACLAHRPLPGRVRSKFPSITAKLATLSVRSPEVHFTSTTEVSGDVHEDTCIT